MSNVKQPTKLRDLLLGSAMVIIGGYLSQFLQNTPDVKLATHIVLMQTIILLYIWYKLKDTLEL